MDMNNLTPEVRVNKHGVPVVKHVRADSPSVPNGFLSRIIPTLNGSLAKTRAAMLADLDGDLEQEAARSIAEADAELERARASTGDVREIRMRLAMMRRAERGLKLPDDSIAKELSGYSTLTVAAIHDAFHGTGKVTSFLKSHRNDDEKYIRTSISFRGCNLEKSTRQANMIRDVASSMGKKDLSRVPEGSDEHYLFSAVIKVAIGASQEREKSHTEIVRGFGSGVSAQMKSRTEYRRWIQDEEACVHMTHELAVLVMEYPERTADIISYLGENKLDPVDVDTDLMRLHLENPTPALADGIL